MNISTVLGFAGFGALCVLVFALRAKQKSSLAAAQTKKKPPRNPELRSFAQGQHCDGAMLSSRWAAMAKQAETGVDLGFDGWQYDPMTERQRSRLESDGASARLLKSCTKGKASDLIGMLERPESETVTFLKYFKKWETGMSQTAALEACRLLWRDDDTREKWDARPPSKPQKIFASLYGLKLPTKSSYSVAGNLISEWIGDDEDKESAFADLSTVIDDLSDPGLLKEDLEIRRPSQKQLVAAINAFGITRLESGELTAEELAEILVSQNPELSRN